MRGADASRGVALQARHRRAQRRSTPCLRCSSAATRPTTPPSAPTSGASAPLGHGHRDPAFPAGGGGVGAGEPGADDEHAAGALRERALQRLGVVAGPQHEHPVELRLVLLGPGPGSYTGGDEQPVVLHLVAVGQPYPPGRHVEAGGRNPEAPPRVDGAVPGEARCGPPSPCPAEPAWTTAVGRTARRARPDHREGTVEPLLPQGLRGPKPRKRGADDDDATFTFEPVQRSVDAHRSVRSWCRGSSRPPRWPGRDTRRRLAPVLAPILLDLGAVEQGLVPVHDENIGSQERALRVSLAAVEIDDKPHRSSLSVARSRPPAPQHA